MTGAQAIALLRQRLAAAGPSVRLAATPILDALVSDYPELASPKKPNEEGGERLIVAR